MGTPTFYNGHLYRIDVGLTASQNEIFEACKVNYGEPFDYEGWSRGDLKLNAKSWRGEKVSASITSPPNKPWDVLIIYDIQAYQEAREYAEKEPERAAEDFGPSGFKSIIFGMQIQEVKEPYTLAYEDRAAGVKRINFKKSDWQTIGFYDLKAVSAEFFNGKLFRIDLDFNDNQNDIYQSFQHRFGPLQDNDAWTQGTTKLKAKSATGETTFAIILSPADLYGKSGIWETIVLLDNKLWQEASQFKKDAPKRAAKDLIR